MYDPYWSVKPGVFAIAFPCLMPQRHLGLLDWAMLTGMVAYATRLTTTSIATGQDSFTKIGDTGLYKRKWGPCIGWSVFWVFTFLRSGVPWVFARVLHFGRLS